MTKKVYKVKNMHCASCAMVIESDLEDAEVKVKCSYPKESLEVEFDEKKITEEKIKKIVEASGYRLASV